MLERLQKILAQYGIASRRHAEELIKEGRVTVNGKVATLGQKADPERDHIKVDGKLLIKPEPKVYYAFYKPRKVITSLIDPQGRPTVKDFIKSIKFRVYPVGRLDYDSEGLLLLTNDGELAYKIMHPSSEIEKTYLVKVDGLIEEKTIEKLRKGMKLEGRLVVPVSVNLIRHLKANSWLRITLHEGRKRQIRKMLERVGHRVLRLIRISINGLKLGELKPGQLRPLTREELEKLRQECEKVKNRGRVP